MSNGFYVAQDTTNDCGYASLAMIFNLIGIKYDKDILKKKLKIEQGGTSAYNIVRAAKYYGLTAIGYKNYELNNHDVPFIALIVNDDNTQHFVVILRVDKEYVQVADPYFKIYKIDKNSFNKKYTKISILFKKDHLYTNRREYNKKTIISLVCLSIIISFLNIFLSYILSFIVKINEQIKNYSFMVIVIIIFLLTGFLKETFIYIKSKLMLKFQIEIDQLITLPFIQKLFFLPFTYYYKTDSGELISKVNDLSYVKSMILEIVEIFLVNFVMILFSSAVIGFISYKFFLLNLLTFIVIFLINYEYLNKNFYKTYDMQMKNESLNSLMSDSFDKMLTIKSLEKEQFFMNKINNKYNSVILEYKSIFKPYYKKEFFISLILLLLNIFLIILLVISNYPTSKIIFLYSVENLIISSFIEIFKLQPLYFNYKSVISRLKNIAKEEHHKKTLLEDIKSIKFKNVNYKYDNKYILKNVSFTINKGQWIMISGKNGSGKTTIFKLLIKEIKETNNNIFINDKLVDYDTLINKITYVRQDIRLFNMNIKDNVFFDKNEVDTNILNDLGISNLNSNLSGGQVQRIIIAQALINGKDIIIFDETTSQLDLRSERKVLLYIKKNYPNKTIILVSHRNNNMDLFDKLVLFKKGKVYERNLNERAK